MQTRIYSSYAFLTQHCGLCEMEGLTQPQRWELNLNKQALALAFHISHKHSYQLCDFPAIIKNMSPAKGFAV